MLRPKDHFYGMAPRIARSALIKTCFIARRADGGGLSTGGFSIRGNSKQPFQEVIDFLSSIGTPPHLRALDSFVHYSEGPGTLSRVLPGGVGLPGNRASDRRGGVRVSGSPREEVR